MKRLLFFLLLPSLLPAATGDLTLTIRPDGYSGVITFEGGTTTTTRDFDYRGWIRGTAHTGTFTIGETMTQATSLATAKILRKEGMWIYIDDLTGVPLATTVWTGGSSGATFTPEICPGMSDPGPGTPYLTVTSLGYDTAGAATTQTRIVYFNEVGRFPYGTEKIPGTVWTGAFTDGETATGSISAVTATVVGAQSGGSHLWLTKLSGAENAADVWTGGTSGATLTSTSTGTAAAASDLDVKATAAGAQFLVFFSRGIYDKDDTGGGNSGTAPTFTCPAGAFVSGGNNNVAASAAAVTNNSALTHTLCVGQWDHIAGVCTYDRVSAAFDVAFNARIAEPEIVESFLGNPSKDRIACVKFTALGLTSAQSTTVTVTSQTPTRRSSTGLWGCAHVATIPITGFTSGESIELRAQVFPCIGDSNTLLDTNSFTTVADECMGKNKATIKYLSTVVYAYVDDDSGNNTTGTASSTEATAAAAPHLNIGEAIEDDPTVIKLDAGTHAAIGDTSDSERNPTEWIRVIPQDGLSATDCIVQMDASVQTYRADRFMFEGVTITLAGTTSYLDGGAQTNFLRFKNCIFESAAVAKPTRPPTYRSQCTYFHNCTGPLNNVEWNLISSADLSAAQFDGCSMGSTGDNVMNGWYRVMACSGGAGSFFGPIALASPGPSHENFLFEHNTMLNHVSAVNSTTFASLENLATGGSIVGNIVERLDTTNPCMWIKGDATELGCKNLLIANNTLTGNRCSWLYADQGGATPYYCINNSVEGNINEVLGTKHDTAPAGTEDGRRVWSFGNVLYGAGWHGNVFAQNTGLGGANSFLNEFPGTGSWQSSFSGTNQPRVGTASPLTFLNYVDRKSGDGSGTEAGGGDYRMHTHSPAYRYTMRGRVLPYDLNGKPRARGDIAGYVSDGGVRRASMMFAQ